MPRESSGDGPSPAPKDICLPCLSTERGRRWGEPRRFRSRYTLSTSPWCRVVLLVSSADDWNGVWERHRDYPQGNTPTACPEPPHTFARLGYSKESDSKKDVDVVPSVFPPTAFGEGCLLQKGTMLDLPCPGSALPSHLGIPEPRV